MSDEVRLSQRIGRLEQILAKLEREDLDLDDALGLFEEGVAHLREAEKLVRTAELRIERLLEPPGDGENREPLEDVP